jgi:hypothetical protein
VTRDALDCARAEELFSDHLEGVLEDPLRADLARHLAVCAECASLRRALEEVVSALRAAPELEPAADLAERAAEAALRGARLRRWPSVPGAVREWMGSRSLDLVRGLAAALTVATTAAILLAGGAATPARAATRAVERTINAGSYLIERKERLVEDFRILRVVIATAFEGRLDRVNDRVDDYRRLLERRRGATPAPAAPGASESGDPNFERPARVQVSVEREENEGAPRPRPAAPARSTV